MELAGRAHEAKTCNWTPELVCTEARRGSPTDKERDSSGRASHARLQNGHRSRRCVVADGRKAPTLKQRIASSAARLRSATDDCGRTGGRRILAWAHARDTTIRAISRGCEAMSDVLVKAATIWVSRPDQWLHT
ncbi:hypothetical protein Aduo_005757 [Ancylostoma duodenale]